MNATLNSRDIAAGLPAHLAALAKRIWADTLYLSPHHAVKLLYMVRDSHPPDLGANLRRQVSELTVTAGQLRLLDDYLAARLMEDRHGKGRFTLTRNNRNEWNYICVEFNPH